MRTGPLRKIIKRDYFVPEGCSPESKVLGDYLECGHVLTAAQDIIGLRWPERRRCYKCARGKPMPKHD